MVSAPSDPSLATPSPVSPVINVDGVESSTNELPLSAITFGAGGAGGAAGGRVASWPHLPPGADSSVWAGAGRRQRHSIAGQMSYLKMLGLGARGKLPGAAGLFSTAVISGSSSAPNLRVCIPSTASSNTALEGFCGVPAIRPLETLHNALSLRQLDAFLERVTAAPVVLGTPPAPAPAPQTKPPSPTNSVGWSGPSSLMSSSGELPSGLSSAGPSSPNSNYASNSDTKNTTSECSAWGMPAAKLPQWGGEGATLTALDHSLRAHMHHNAPGSSISGSVTPVSLASELEFNSNEATAGSITDQDLMSAEGEDDEETLSVDPCGSPVRVIKNDLSPQPADSCQTLDYCQPSTSASHFYGLDLSQTKENLGKDMPSSSKNFNLEFDVDSKCRKEPPLHLNLNKEKVKREEILNNDRSFSDSSSLKSNISQGSRFKTTLVVEDSLRPDSSSGSKSNNNVDTASAADPNAPLLLKANNSNVKPGFNLSDS
ncbi:hypothetical protein O0L34_g7266 [Tuta absoluta]|nr:hypothetical protein O0L34_g7266 [Tuta absoluta]